MIEKEYKKLYDSLLKTDELFELGSEFVGVWEEDRTHFVELQNDLEYLAETPLIEDEDEYEEDSY